MKYQHILVTVLVFSLCQWSVSCQPAEEIASEKVKSDAVTVTKPDAATIETSTSKQADQTDIVPITSKDEQNITTQGPPVPPTLPANITTTTTTTTPPPTTPPTTPPTNATTTTPPPPTTPNTTSTEAPTTSTTTTTTTLKPTTTPEPITTTTAPAPPKPSRHFDMPSFIGGIVFTIGLIAIGFVGHKIYKSKFDRNYHTL